MLCCWDVNPDARPSFVDILSAINKECSQFREDSTPVHTIEIKDLYNT